MITIFVAKDFFWIDRVNNLFVYPAQCFIVKDPSTLPLPVDNSGWENYYSTIQVAKF